MFIARANIVVGQQDRGPDSAAGARPERRIIIERLAAASLLLPDPVDMIQLLQIITRILRDGVPLVHNLLLLPSRPRGWTPVFPTTVEGNDLAYARGLDSRGDRATGGRRRLPTLIA